jgi:hypothetical protein
MNPSERIDRLIAELTDWRGPTKSRMLALTAIYAENKTTNPPHRLSPTLLTRIVWRRIV